MRYRTGESPINLNFDANESIEILLVEDNPGDVRLVQEAFKDADSESTLHVTTNGDEALTFLSRRVEDESETVPDLVLLDLNLPRVDGLTVLESIRDDPALTHIPVLILSSSEASEDIAASYELAANAYLTKPDGPDEFTSLVEAVEGFWVGCAQLPPVPA